MQPVTTGYASRDSLLEFVRAKVQQTPERAPDQPDDGAPSSDDDVSVPLGYTSTARSVPVRAATPGSISVLA